jgi:oxygen-independent coproporphyrinogen-3 oxidase
VDRVSFGAQSFAPAELRFLDRLHSPHATAASVANARRAGIASVGLDLMYGLPGQSLGEWRASLQAALALQADHISCYALTVEDGTPLARRVDRGDVAAPDPDAAASMYELAEDTLAAAGFRHYELSNWARPRHESRHNLVYWTGGDYLGIGAGAHGFLDGERYENVAHPRAYVERLCGGRSGPRPAVLDSYHPAGATAAVDWLEARLRLADGFEWAAFDFGPEVNAAVTAVLDEAAQFGLVERAGATGDIVRLTRRGRLLHGELCARLLARLA